MTKLQEAINQSDRLLKSHIRVKLLKILNDQETFWFQRDQESNG